MANRINKVTTRTKTRQAPVMSDGKLSYSLYDSAGNKVGNTLVAPGTDMSNVKNNFFSMGENGLLEMSDTPKVNVSIDKETGNVKVAAPKSVIDNDIFKTQVSDTLKSLSSVYKTNPEYKFSVTGEDGTTKEKTVQDIINDLNAPIKNDDGSYNPNSVQYIANAALGIERTKEGHRKNGVELTNNEAILINTVAVGPDVKDDTLQLISDLPEAKFLRDISTYNPETGMAQRKDILENAWNKEKVSSEDMIKLFASLEKYFEKGNFSNKEEYIRNVATMRFISSTQPEMSWIRDVVENIKGLVDGVLSYPTNLGTGALVAAEYASATLNPIGTLILKSMGSDQWAQYSDIYIRRGGNQFDENAPLEKVDAKINRVVFDGQGVPSIQTDTIEGSFSEPKTYAQSLRAIYKENQAVIKKDLEYLHSSQAGWDTVGYVVANIATLIAAGNALSDAFVAGGSKLLSSIASSISGSAESLAGFAETMYASGTALGTWDTIEGATLLAKGLGTIYDVASIMGNAAAWVNSISSVLSSSAVLTPILGLVGESLGEAIVGNPDRFVEFLKSTEITDDTKNYMIETYVGNAIGWGIGLSAGKFLMKLGETAKGRAISYNLSKRIFKVQNAVGDAFDTLILRLRRVKGDDIADQIETLRSKGGRAAKQANSLAATQLLRQAREAIIESDSIKILGQSTDDIEKALADAESKITELRNMENALTSMQRRGMDIASAWLKDEGSSLKAATQNFYKTAADVADLEKGAGKAFAKVSGAVTDVTSGKTIRLFSQTTTNYIKATEKLDYINAYLAYYENAPDITDAILKNIEAYKKEAVELQGMIDVFIDQATPQLKAAADRFIDVDRKWWSAFEDLRSDIGLTDANELEWFRKSGLWGEDGSMYAQTGRRADLSEYVVKHRDGSSNVKTFDNYEQYMAGATGDFADPMAQMQVALYDSANKEATRSFAKSYDALTGSMTTKVSGQDTAMVTRMKKGLQKAYEDGSKKFLSGIAEGVEQDDVVNDVVKNLKTKVGTKIEQNKNRKTMRTSAENMQKKLTAVDDSSAGRYISRLDPQSTDNLWDEFYDVTPRQLMADGKQFVPTKTKRYIYAKARDLGIDTSNIPDYPFVSSTENITEVEDKYAQLVKKAKNYKTPERFEKMNNPIKGSEIWGEKPTSAFQLDDRGVRVNLFPNKAVEGTGITKQYLLNLFKDAYEQDVTRIFPSYGSYTKEGASFMDHLAEQGWVKATGNNGLKSYEIAPKIAEWEKTSPLLDIYNSAHNIAPDVSQQVVSNNLLKTYDAVNQALTGAATPDPSFENTVKRSIMSQNDMITTNKTVQNTLSEMNQARYTAKYETFLKDLDEQYAELGRQYNIAVEELQVAGGQQTEAYIESMTREGSLQRAAIDEMCRYYGLEGDQNAVRYFALSAFVDNEAKYKEELFTQLKEMIDESNPELKFEKAGKNKTQSEKVASILTNGIAETMEEEFNDMYLIVKEMNPDAVHDTTEKMMDEVNRIAKEIEGVKANQYAGEKNIVALRNNAGQVEYYETDPLLAGLLNFRTSAQQISGLGQAIYNANYLWTKLFRLGTTAINIKSMISQSFRDPINMFIGGGAYRTSQQVADNLTDVFGEDIVDYLKMYEPDVLRSLQATADETGENVARLAVQRELARGRALSPAATETSMYRSLRNARAARLNGVEDIYDVTTMDRITNAIDNVAEKGGKLNEIREKTLRNVAYANGLEIAMKRGYSLDQARTYATFIMNESTTNFTRMTNHLIALRDTVPYLGSAINGSKSFWRLLSFDPVGVIGRLVGGIIIPQIALTAYSLNDEENRKIYKSIPEYQKDDNLIFVVHGQIFSVPVPQELSSFIAPFRQMVESMYGTSTNTFTELLTNDILGFSPIDLSGFADLDFSKIETSSPGFTERIGKGVMKLWSQLAPAPLKSGLEMVTGVDPYTGRKIDTSYTDIDENGNFIVKDYKSGLLAKSLNDMFRSWGVKSSAPVVQNVLSNILGDASVDVADFLVSLLSAIPNGGLNWSMDTAALRANEAYNPFYTLAQRASAPITVDVYDEAQSNWKSAVTQLYQMKEELLRSDEWQNYLKAKSQTTDTEKLQKLNSTKKDLVEDYFDRVKAIVSNLQNNYGEQLTPAKYASVLSLMTMEEQTLDSGSYGNYLNTELYKNARAQAIQTMIELGFPSATGQDILGRYVTDRNGDIRVEVYHPLAMLQLDDAKGGAIRTQSNKQHFAVIRNLISEAGLYDQRSDYQKQISNAKKNKDYTKAEKLTNEYNEKVIRAVGPYIEEYTPESVLAGDALEYLKEYIIVPSSFQTNRRGRYATSLRSGAYLSDAFEEPYLKYIFNYGENKL